MALNNASIGGSLAAIVEELNRMCPAAKNSNLGNILDNLQSITDAPVADITALQAIVSGDRQDKQMIAVEHVGFFMYDAASILLADAHRIIVPDDVTHPAAGRWMLVANLSSGFYFVPPVLDKDIVDSTGAAAVDGNRYLIDGAGATLWAGHDYEIAEYTSSGGWVFTPNDEGTIVEVEDENKLYISTGTAWVDFGVMVAIDRENLAYVDKLGSNTTGEVGNFARPYLTIAGAHAAIATIGTAAAAVRFKIIVGPGEYDETITCVDFVDIDLGTARIIPATGHAVVLENNMTLSNGILMPVTATDFCFDVGAVDVEGCNVINTQYGDGKVVLTTGAGGAFVNFINIQPLPGSAVTVFADTSAAGTLGNFFNCTLDGTMASDDEINLYDCVCTGAWTVADNMSAVGTTFVGAFSLNTVSATSYLKACNFNSTFTLLVGTCFSLGNVIVGAADTNDALAILYSISSSYENTLTTTLGNATITGGRIAGAIDVSGGALVLSNDIELGGAITGAPTYLGTPLREIGGVGFSYISFTGVPNVDDAFTIAGRSYWWDNTGAGDVNLTRTPGNVGTSLTTAVAEINADAAGDGVAYAILAAGSAAGNGVLILVHEDVATDFALVITTNVGVTMTAAHANSVGDFAAARQDTYRFRRTMVAQDVLAFAAAEGVILGCIPSTVAPRYLNVFATDVNGVIIPINGFQINAHQVGAAWYELELIDTLGAAAFAATDLIYVEAQGN